ncbi:MAG: hypothetical protein OXJ55_18485 [Caldilineaceae bacterium]|nr:hypothetical protein [Caldilineaceae bacterium]
MKNRMPVRAAKPLAFLLLVAIFAALTILAFYPDSATYAQTEASETLAAPVLTARLTATNTVELGWTAVSGAVRYELLVWQDSATGWQRLDDGSVTGTAYTHGGLAAGTTYYYIVRGLDANGAAVSAWSDHTTATLTSTPTATLTATPSAGAVELSWTEVSGAVRYDLRTWWDAAIGWQQIGGGSLTGTTHTHTGLAAGTTYYYIVRGLDANGVAVSAWSDHAVAIPTSTSTAANSDREALVALYNATGGANWTNNTNWLSDRPLDEWHGVHTDEFGRVTSLMLGTNRLIGTLPSELGDLANLTNLDLTHNQLSGALPFELGDLANLTDLWLAGNQLSGALPPELGNLTNLRWLYLSDNQLSGSLPSELGNLANLTLLYLPGNQLSGALPPELGNLANLEWLCLTDNQLSGALPPELGNLTNLKWLIVSVNQLSGSIPSELGNLTNLAEMSLANNRLSGMIPSELGNLANLTDLRLQGNQLSGTLPSELGDLANLTNLDLSYNQLSGSIPSELGNLTNLAKLGIRENQFTGCVPAPLRNVPENDLDQLGLLTCAT